MPAAAAERAVSASNPSIPYKQRGQREEIGKSKCQTDAVTVSGRALPLYFITNTPSVFSLDGETFARPEHGTP